MLLFWGWGMPWREAQWVGPAPGIFGPQLATVGSEPMLPLVWEEVNGLPGRVVGGLNP